MQNLFIRRHMPSFNKRHLQGIQNKTARHKRFVKHKLRQNCFFEHIFIMREKLVDCAQVESE